MDEQRIEIQGGLWLTAETPCWQCGRAAPFAMMMATSGSLWDGDDSMDIDEPIFINEIGDLPEPVLDQLRDLVPTIWTPADDSRCQYVRNRCDYCQAFLDDWHLCKVGGPLIAEGGDAAPGIVAVALEGTPFRLLDADVTFTELGPVLDHLLQSP